MRRSTNRGYDDYKSETDLTVQLMNLGKQIGMEPAEGTTYFYAKTKEGYRLKEQIKSVEEIDITYYWDTISNLLIKFGLKEYCLKQIYLIFLVKFYQSCLSFFQNF